MLNDELVNEPNMDSNSKEWEEFKNFEKRTLNKIYEEKIFKDIPDTKDILGDFLDRVIGRSMYLYNNR